MCNRVGIINRGMLVATGSVDELRESTSANSTLEEVFLKVTSEADA
jgi:ABC-2 type transport system ATP-binding protein